MPLDEGCVRQFGLFGYVFLGRAISLSQSRANFRSEHLRKKTARDRGDDFQGGGCGFGDRMSVRWLRKVRPVEWIPQCWLVGPFCSMRDIYDQPVSNRLNCPPEFKALVALEANKGEKSIARIAAEHRVFTNQVKKWKDQFSGVEWVTVRGRRMGGGGPGTGAWEYQAVAITGKGKVTGLEIWKCERFEDCSQRAMRVAEVLKCGGDPGRECHWLDVSVREGRVELEWTPLTFEFVVSRTMVFGALLLVMLTGMQGWLSEVGVKLGLSLIFVAGSVCVGRFGLRWIYG